MPWGRKRKVTTLETFAENLEAAMVKASGWGTRPEDQTAIALATAALRSRDKVSKDLAIAGLLGILLEELALRDVLHAFLGRYGTELGLCEDIEANEVVTHLRNYFIQGFIFLDADARLQTVHAASRVTDILAPFYPEEASDGQQKQSDT